MSNRSEQELVRISKLRKLKEEGFAFPNNVPTPVRSGDLLSREIKDPESSDRVSFAGRIVQIRLMGKAAFLHLLDEDGRIQIYIKKEVIGEDSFNKFAEFDRGDIIHITGYLFITKTGEKTIFAESLQLLTKALIPLPEKWHGLTDTEARYRYRYLDLISNPEVRGIFKARANIISYIRNFLDNKGYLEVETPSLQQIAGGTLARPFQTHHNALGCDLFLRIALELPLKKLIVGGFNRVYEIGRVFRNEGIDRKHSPEFTMLEFYEAYATFNQMMEITEELIVGLCNKLNNGLKLKFGDYDIDFTPPWPRVSMSESLYTIGEMPKSVDVDSLSDLLKYARSNKIEISDSKDWGRVLESIWGEIVEPKIINPVFITGHPFSISPLARKNDTNPNITDRFELIVAGMELANAFSELNDPIDQRERFEEQAKRKAMGDQEACDVDHDFLKAIEVGLPPTGGEGIGIDRLVMLMTNSSSIRDVVLFPQLKPEEGDKL